MKVLTAGSVSWCESCNEEISEGDPIVETDLDETLHAQCAEREGEDVEWA